MVTPYGNPLTIDDIDEMRFTPEGERRDEQPGYWGRFAAILLDSKNDRRWARMITNLKKFNRVKSNLERAHDDSRYWKSRGKRAKRKFTRVETGASILSFDDKKRMSRRFELGFGRRESQKELL